MNVALEKAAVPVLGGTVFGTPSGQDSVVSVDGVLYKDACAWMLVKNTSGKIRTYSENIYAVPEDAKTHVATKVNLTTKELISLDNRPASEVYTADLGFFGRHQNSHRRIPSAPYYHRLPNRTMPGSSPW